MVYKYSKSKIKHSVLFDRAVNNGLKVGYLDIETSPYLVWTYALRDAYISSDQIEQTLKVTSIVLLEEGEKKPIVYEWDFDPGTQMGDDKKMLSNIAKLLNKFDVLIMQNGDSYDIKVLQERLLQHKLTPLFNIITIDTLKLSRRSFRKSSHSLDTRSKEYHFGGKDKQGMDACIAVAKGDKKQHKRRLLYNMKDVMDTRKVFLRELDYYDLDSQTLKLLNSFTHNDRECCSSCAAKRQRRFDIELVTKIKQNRVTGKKTKEKFYECRNCSLKWRIK